MNLSKALQNNLTGVVQKRCRPGTDSLKRHCRQFARHRKAQRKRRRTDRQKRPIDERALRPGTHGAHFEDAVDGHKKLVDQKQRRHGQTDQAERGEPRRVAGEFVEIAHKHARVLLGQKAHHDEILQALPGFGKTRKSGKDRQRQRKHGHDGKQGRERHGRGHFADFNLNGSVGNKAHQGAKAVEPAFLLDFVFDGFLLGSDHVRQWLGIFLHRPNIVK